MVLKINKGIQIEIKGVSYGLFSDDVVCIENSKEYIIKAIEQVTLTSL
jgi:hypothetical protein